MSRALYLRWRPARFDQVVGQEHVTRTLQQAVAADRVGHAYLFSGPRGTGKTTLARLLAKAVNCVEADQTDRPCDRCGPCKAVNEGRFLDLIEIDAASNTGVDDIRVLRDRINFSPNEGRFKVYIIDEVHMLSQAAFNALLKTLEEPPAHAKFVLATTEEHKVPLTIKSRCQSFSFRLLTMEEIIQRVNWLAEKESLVIEPAAVEMVASHATGSLRDAESLLDQLYSGPGETVTLEKTNQVLGTASNETVLALTEAWLQKRASDGLAVIHNALDSGADPTQFCRQMVLHLRQLLLHRTSGAGPAISDSDAGKARVARQVAACSRRDLINALKSFDEALRSPSRFWQPRLPLELAFLALLPDEMADASRGVPGKQHIPEEKASVDASPAKSRLAKAAVTMKKQKPTPEVEARPDREPSVPAPQVVAPESVAATEQDDGGDVAESAVSSLTIDFVRENWPKVKDAVGREDRNLRALLAMCKPLALEGKLVVLGFEFPLIRDKFAQKKGAEAIVSKALEDISGQGLRVRAVVTSEYAVPAASAKVSRREIEDLAKELGGIVRDTE